MFGLSINGILAGIISIIVGIIVLVWPRFVTTIIGIYLIIVGILAIIGSRS